MNIEEIFNKIVDILKELHEEIDFKNQENLVDDKILDSFDLITLVSELSDKFDVEITPENFIAENFNSAKALSNMIQKLLDE